MKPHTSALLLAVALTSCREDTGSVNPNGDASSSSQDAASSESDAAPPDAAPPDAALPDAAPRDAAPPDASSADAAVQDAGAQDTGPTDAGPDPLCMGQMCPAGQRCNVWTRMCQDRAIAYPPAGEDNGGPCTMDSDCRSNGTAIGFRGVCHTPNGADYCTSFCALPADWGTADTFVQSDCPTGSVCFAQGLGIYDDGDVGACVQACTDDSQCRTADGYFCRRQFGGRMYTNGYCAPSHCRSRGCNGHRCDC